MSDFIMLPKIDFAFKEIMMNEEVRKGFLSAILSIKVEDIKSTIILNTNLSKRTREEKQGILDVRLCMNDDTEIDIEIQLAQMSVWAERSLFYMSKMYSDQIKEGEKYEVLKKCISISILNFKLFNDDKYKDKFYSRFHILEDTEHFQYTDKFEFHLIELPKLPKELKNEKDDILLWAKFINADKKEEFDMLATKNQYINTAYGCLKTVSMDEQKRYEYEAREKAIRDHNQIMSEALERGLTQGMQQGMQQGIQVTTKKIAEEMLKNGLDAESVVKCTGLGLSEVEELKRNL